MPPPVPEVVAITPHLREVVSAIEARVRSTGATRAARHRAVRTATAELAAARSPACALSLALRHLPSVRATRLHH